AVGPPGHWIDRRLVDRQMRTDRSGVPLEHIGGELAAVGECKAARLLRHRSRDARAPVADPDDDSAARCIQVCPPLRIPDGRTLGAYGHGQLRISRTPENAPGRVSRRRWSSEPSRTKRRTQPRKHSFAPIARWAASARELHFGPGCCGSWPTKRATVVVLPAGERASP